MKIEIRSIKGLTFRAATEGFIGTLVGHAAMFNSDSVEFAGWEKPWVERIAPGAFKRSLTEQPDVKALAQHDSAAILGRAPGTLTLSEDDKGLAIEIRLVDTQLNRDTLTLVRSGIIDSMSFDFIPTKTQWEEGEKRDIRTLLDVDLHEVSVVTWPAYPAAHVGARGIELAGAELAAIKAERDQFLTAKRATAPSANHLLRYWERRMKSH